MKYSWKIENRRDQKKWASKAMKNLQETNREACLGKGREKKEARKTDSDK